MPVTRRHERKYTLPAHLAADVAVWLRLQPGGLRPAYPPRYINNLYFDSSERRRYLDNIEGLGWRDKVRIRWYGELWGTLAEPVLEIKLKAGHAGGKHRFPLPAFTLSRSTSRKTLNAIPAAATEGSPRQELRDLEAILVTRYRRRYYATRDRRIRLTLDEDVRYLRGPGTRGFTSSWRRDNETILELKYDVEQEVAAFEVAQAVRLRLTRSSKFAKGIAATAC